MTILDSKPDWGHNLQPGFCGFITREKNFVGDGIAWFERFSSGLPFIHTFIIEGCSVEPVARTSPAGTPSINPGLQSGTESPTLNSQPSTINILEAHAKLGVHRTTLNEYFGDANCQCFIRQPIGWTSDIGQKIVAGAAAHLGEKYGFGLIVADALANSYLGHLLNYWTHNVPDDLVCKLFTDRHRQICSQLVAGALKELPYLRIRGILRNPSDTIMPAPLGNDPSIWDPCIYKIS